MPKLREALLKKRRGGPIETFSEEDERGNLSIWQEGGEDMDPYQTGIQDKPSVGAPADPNAQPIFMTNIPQGGIGPSLNEPGGVPGSAQDRAQIDEQAKAAGSTVMDLSFKKKMPKKPEDWVGSGIDLNAPGERDRFIQGVDEDFLGGFGIANINPSDLAEEKYNPVYYPNEFKKLREEWQVKKEAAMKILDRQVAMFDERAKIQASMRKHKAESEKGKAEAKDKDEKRLLELSSELVKLAGERRKLKKEQTEIGAGVYDPNEMVSINRLNTQVDNRQRAIQGEISRIEARLGRSAPTQKPVSVKPETPQQKEAKAFAANARARGLTKEQAIEEFKKLKATGPGPGAGAVSKSTPAKIIKPAPTTPVKKSSGVSGSWGPPPPSTSQSPAPAPGINIGGPPVTINTKDMVELADSIGINKENLDTALKAAAAAGGFTIDVLLTKPKNIIKRLLELAVSSQSETRKQMGL